MNRKEFLQKSAAALAFLALVQCKEEQKQLQKNQILGCFGDSITATKDGYVAMLQNYLKSSKTDFNLKAINLGKSSETITGLTENEHPGPRPYLFDRLNKDLKVNTIQTALFCYGINCGIYGPPSDELFAKFKKGVTLFISEMRVKDIGVVLLTPPPLALDVVSKIRTNANDEYGYLNPYPEYDSEVLQEFKKIILGINDPTVIAKIDIHTPLFANREAYYDLDPIHPNLKGHQIIADTIIKGLVL